MPFVKRDEEGAVIALSEEQAPGFHEELPANDAAVVAFLQGMGGEASTLAASDLDLIRVLEDVVELLIAKGVILFTDLPAEAQQKILRRQQLRSQGEGLSNLIGED